jgi:hypothetical protein
LGKIQTPFGKILPPFEKILPPFGKILPPFFRPKAWDKFFVCYEVGFLSAASL